MSHCLKCRASNFEGKCGCDCHEAMTHEEKAREIVAEGYKKNLRCGELAHLITLALISAEKKGRSMMCEHKERDEIGGNCEVCAEIVKEGGAAYKRGYEKGREEERPSAFGKGYSSGWNEAIDAAVKVAEEIKFERICQEHGHDDGDIRWSFNGCKEIADKIKTLKKG